MAVAVAPTLACMADVYARSAAGGVESERFRAYVEAASSGAPIHGYNPMTSAAAADTVAALLAIDAESRLATIAGEVAARVGHDAAEVMHLTVATPGMWTDRLATEVEHRLLAHDPSGVLWWCGEAVDAASFDAAVAAQTARLIRHRRLGPPVTLADAVDQEGTAGAQSGATGRLDAGAAEVLEILGADEGLATKVAFLYGDDAASAMGFTPLGLRDEAGRRHAIALATVPRS